MTLTLTPYTDVIKDEMLREIARRGDVRAFPALSTLLREGDTTDAFYILLSGRVKVFGTDSKGREVVYNTMGPGEYFGELSLDGSARSASVQCLEPVKCVMVRGTDMREFLGQHPDFALHLIRHLIALLRRSTDSVKSLALDDVYSRLAKLLQEMAEPDVSGRLVVPHKLTQQDLAERVGASREMISRILQQLVKGGYIERQGRRMVLLKKLPPGW
ncbi:Crp/Fnr family transcriptional regulator [Paucibacter aquatile]|uniref:Crp/Fnr family transcriptional regulator n=1 Tax=Kinneretia aquatilis TaxID=2070761 RepID=A0A2N8KYQ0_9BURK|nr:Crp/Fnr family transcriptional regulator [Paucibacter aquatile]PND38579.1 Crp/Fnr family transcriptional regulator [Paucibacter aquatile]WIV97599.1 Crp/Fnr family transcriptional regulator [Paucibacter aquatile]